MSALPNRVRSDASVGDDLDERIRAAELRLVTREEQLQRGLEGLGLRVRTALQPRRLLAPALGVAAAGIALWWGLRRLRPVLSRTLPVARPARADTQDERQAGQGRRAGGELPWASLLGLVWPLLPAPWRARVSPTTATTLIGVGLPLVQKLFDHGPPAPPLAAMPQVDLARYAGTWHEIARLPEPFEAACTDQPSATYELHGTRLAVINRCRKHGRLEEVHGEGRVVPGSGGAKLEISLWPQALRWLPMAWAKYWILYVDPAYQVALVGHPSRRFLWVLARTPVLSTPQLDALLEFAEQRGFPIERLVYAQPDTMADSTAGATAR